MMEHTEVLSKYVGNFVDELVASGLTHAVISPGSRSTPIAMLLEAHQAIETTVIVDERSASFFALGIAKETKKPVVIVCTSGTAAANYYPAIIEAYYSQVPLLILTADRPHELRDVDAPQAIQQLNMFGEYPVWFHEMALPEATPNMLNYARSKAARAMHIAMLEHGPVHLNFPLREPLIPNVESDDIWGKRRDMSFYPTMDGELKPNAESLSQLSNHLSECDNGLIVCGPLVDEGEAQAIVRLASHLQVPLLADPLSQVRTIGMKDTVIIESYDAILRDKVRREQLRPDYILRFGAMPVSKMYRFYLETHYEAERYVVSARQQYREPSAIETHFVHSNVELFVEGLIEQTSVSDKHTTWLSRWIQMDEAACSVLCTNDSEVLTEGEVVTQLSQILPDDELLFVGNSMAIRDVDTFMIHVQNQMRILANRGANGIDGVVSTAAGTAKTGKHVTLLIGDLSFYHDMNGLHAIQKEQLSVTIILINNEGGGIFSFLPQHNDKAHFESLFGTPLNIDFKHAAHLYNAHYAHVQTIDEFTKCYKQALEQKGLTIIEVQTNREENMYWHKAKWAEIHDRLSQME